MGRLVLEPVDDLMKEAKQGNNRAVIPQNFLAARLRDEGKFMRNPSGFSVVTEETKSDHGYLF